jgi:hypothetical protein
MNRSMAGLGGAVAMAVLTATAPAQAAPAPDLAAIQKQIDAMRADYEARIGELERRLAAAEAAAPALQPVATAEAQAAPEAAAAGEVLIAVDETPAPQPVAAATANGNAMNPGISVVLNGNYVAASRDPAGSAISGFALGEEAGAPSRGFSLGESEVTLTASVDPFLTAGLTAAFGGDGEVGVEEAYIQSTSLPGGLTLKGGRFFSGVGYLNERHAHNWSFIDMPLPYRALLGSQYGDDGVQARWLAPTPFFLELGGELFRGDAFPAGGAAKKGAGTKTAFLHTGADINDSSSWLAALSYIHTDASDRVAGGDLFSGKTELGIASLVYKWAPGGNPTQRNLTLSGEYFRGSQDGTFNTAPIDRDQNGWYAQGVYQFRKGWSAGVRYAQMGAVGAPGASLIGSALDGLGRTPRTWSGLLEFDTSEFGRFRAQFTRDLSDARPNNLLFLQYTIVYGPHAAHRY